MIELAPGLKVKPAEVATQVIATLGMRGSGKSTTMAVIAEGLLAAKVQVVILDYVGIWFSLRLQSDGKTPSPYQIAVLGGRHGDIGIQPTAGKVVAEALAHTYQPAVLDVSEFSKGDRCRFATDFAEAFFAAKKRSPGPVLVILEEAQRFVPQKMFTGQERMLGAFEEIAEVGRNYGIGLGLISQRPQKINKDVLNLTELLFAFQTNGVLERKALSEWVQEKDADGRSEVMGELPKLERGHALVWSPSWLRIYGEYALRKKSTYDASATPLHARAAVKVKALDLATLETEMVQVVEQARQDDPRALRQRVRELEQQLAKKQPAGLAKVERVEVPVMPPGLRAAAKAAQKALDLVGRYVQEFSARMAREVDVANVALGHIEVESGKRPVPAVAKQAVVAAAAPTPNYYRVPVEMGQPKLVGKMRRIVDMLAALHPEALPYNRLALLVGMKVNGGGFRNYLGNLKQAGIITAENGAARLANTEYVNPGATRPTGYDLVALWAPQLPGKAVEALNYLRGMGPMDLQRLASLVGMDVDGGGFRNYVGALKTAGLVVKDGGQYRVTEDVA
jgi:hypothetical protein